MKKSEIKLAAYSLTSLINLAKTNAQYPPSVSKDQITGYCAVYDKQKHEMDLIETIDNNQNKCTNGKIIQKNEISQRITIGCSECEVFYSANNELPDRELEKSVKFNITGDNSNYSQTILINRDNVDVGN